MIVATAIDRAFVEPACVLLASIVANGGIAEAEIVVFGLGLNSQDLKKLKSSCGPMADRCSLFDLGQMSGRLKKLPVTLSVPSVVTYARLLIPEILSNKASRLLYLDSDIVVVGSLRPLMDIPLENSIIAAVPDQPADDSAKAYRSSVLKLSDPDRYLNAGVLLVDVAAWQQAGKTDEAFDMINSLPRGTKLAHLDQDVLNAIFAGRWSDLDRRYNFFQHGYEQSAPLDVFLAKSVVHFASGNKPWFRDSDHPARELYLKYRRVTPFADKPLATRNAARASTLIRSPITTVKNIVHRLVGRRWGAALH